MEAPGGPEEPTLLRSGRSFGKRFCRLLCVSEGHGERQDETSRDEGKRDATRQGRPLRAALSCYEPPPLKTGYLQCHPQPYSPRSRLRHPLRRLVGPECRGRGKHGAVATECSKHGNEKQMPLCLAVRDSVDAATAEEASSSQLLVCPSAPWRIFPSPPDGRCQLCHLAQNTGSRKSSGPIARHPESPPLR